MYMFMLLFQRLRQQLLIWKGYKHVCPFLFSEFYDFRKQNHNVENQESNSVEFFDSSRKDSPANSKLSLTRPGNPTPAEAINGDSGLGIHRDTQSRSRPYNPTPLHAGKNSSFVKMENSIEEIPESREHRVERDENLLQSTLRKQQLQETGPFNDEISSQAYIMTPDREFAIDNQFGGMPAYLVLVLTVRTFSNEFWVVF